MDTKDLVLRHLPAGARPVAVLLGGLVTMLSLGVLYTFGIEREEKEERDAGNLLPYLVSFLRWRINPQQTQGSLIWLQTVQSGIPFSMLLGGLLERRLGARRASAIGSLVYTTGTALSFFTIKHSFIALIFTFGFTCALGSGIAYNAVLIVAQRWLPQRVGLAAGLIVAGYGCSAFVFAPLQTHLVNPWNLVANKEGYFTQPQLLERVPYVFLWMAASFLLLQCLGLIFLGEPIEARNRSRKDLQDPTTDNEFLLSEGTEEEPLRTQLCSSTFWFLFLTLLCNSTWVQIMAGLYKTFGLTFIHDDFFLSAVASVASVFNCVSRIAWGLVADLHSYQLAMATVCSLGAVLIWTLPIVRFFEAPWAFLFSISFMFSCVGGTYSLLPFATHRAFGAANFGLLYGYEQASLSLAGVLAALLSQFAQPLLDYPLFFLLSGFFLCISFILTSLLHLTKFGSSIN